MKKKFNIEKLTNWEYWPSSMFYVPNLPYAFYLAIKARSSVFFTAANPGIKSSGNGTESKYETILLVPEEFRPKSVLIKPNTNFLKVKDLLEKNNIHYPIIAKPDVGFRGLLVKKINSDTELQSYLQNYPINFILQEFLDYKNECGVFYHRKPNQSKGYISSVTLKKFISVTGNGIHNLQELILADNRAKLYIDLFREIHQDNLLEIPPKNKEIRLTVIGNHSKGTQFINGNHLISKELTYTFDKLSNNIDGWYYGRIDLKYNSFKELEKGKNFKILEINGIIAEPTHIYDTNNYTYFKALKAIRSHWKSLYDIAVYNNKSANVPYIKTLTFVNEILWLKEYTKKLKSLKNS